MRKTDTNNEPLVVPLKNKQDWLVVYCSALHLLLFWLTYNLIRFALSDFFKPTDKLTIDGANFAPVFNIATIFMNSFVAVVSIVLMFFVNLLLTLITTAVFNIAFYKTVPDDKELLMKHTRTIMLWLSISGGILLVLLNLRAFPFSLIITATHYLLFSIAASVFTWLNMKRVYRKDTEAV